MRIINAAKAALGVLILIVLLQPLLGAEQVEGEGGAGGQGPVQQEMKAEPVHPIEAKSESGAGGQGALQQEKKAELDPQLKSFIEQELGKCRVGDEKHFEALKASLLESLKAQEERHKENLKSLETKYQKALDEQVENISKVISRDPPSFKQRITSSKYIWVIGLVTGGAMVMSFVHHCDSVYSIPYATVRAILDNFPVLINTYYVTKIAQEAGAIKGSVASQAAKME